MTPKYLVVDIETCPHERAAEFIPAPQDIPAPDLSLITAAGNLKDPQKIADSIAARKQAALDQHAERQQAARDDYQAQITRSALDWNLNRIVAIAWQDEDGPRRVTVCQNEAEEAAMLTAFWKAALYRYMLGFCARTFDVPTLIQRSRLLGVECPYVNLGRYGKGDVIDLRDILTFDDARYEAIMPRSLKAFCRRFGIPVNDQIGGGDIPALVAANDWDSVVSHVSSDLELTVALARRLRVIRADEPAQQAAGF